MESVLEEGGLGEVLAYLREVTGRPVTISDYRGRVYARTEMIEISSPDECYLALPPRSVNKHFYNSKTKKLYYWTGNSEKEAYIVIENVEPGDPEALESYLEEASLAVKVYFTKVHTAKSVESTLTHKLIEDLLVRNINIKEILKRANISLDLNNLYYVPIMEAEKASEKEMSILHAYTKEWLRLNNLDIICTLWDKKYLVFICPTHYCEKTLEVDFGWDKHLANIKRHQKNIKAKFNISVSFGVGRKYPLAELHKSYQEALIALNLSKLTGKKNFVEHFLDLGVFTLICYQDTNLLKRFCDKYLGKLLEYDRLHNNELMPSLRVFFDANLNVKKAAQKMYVHTNTLKYRLKKIEELTGMRLQRIEERVNLFVALKLYDVLVANGLLRKM